MTLQLTAGLRNCGVFRKPKILFREEILSWQRELSPFDPQLRKPA